MTEEKAKKIAEIMTADQEKAERLLKLSAEEAAAEFGKLGCDVTVEELNQLRDELVEAAKHVNANGELDEEALGNVSGGASKAFNCGFPTGFLIAHLAVVTIAVW